MLNLDFCHFPDKRNLGIPEKREARNLFQHLSFRWSIEKRSRQNARAL